MSNQNDDHNKIDWTEFENVFFGKDADKPTYEVDQVGEFDEAFEGQLDAILEYCKRKKIPIVLGMSLLRSETEEVDARVRTMGRTMIHIPMDTDATVCELVAMSAIMQMPHEFSHMVIELAEMWNMIGRMRDEDEDNQKGNNK